MMFDNIIEMVRDNGKSGMAYGKAINLATQAMIQDSDRAAGYLLLKVLAERFVETTGRLPITSAQTAKAYDDFFANVITLRDAYASGDSDGISTALNKVSLASLERFDLSSPATR